MLTYVTVSRALSPLELDFPAEFLFVPAALSEPELYYLTCEFDDVACQDFVDFYSAAEYEAWESGASFDPAWYVGLPGSEAAVVGVPGSFNVTFPEAVAFGLI